MSPAANARLRILMVIGSLHTGGSESQMLLLARLLKAAGHDVRVLALRAEGPLLRDAARSGIGVADARLPRRGRGMAFRSAASLLRARRIVARFRPDIVHAWLYEACIFAAALRLTAAPGRLVLNLRGLEPQGRTVRRLLWRFALGQADGLLANSEAVLRRFESQVAPRAGLGLRSAVIPNAADPEPAAWAVRADLQAEFGIPENARPRVLCVANLIPYKGHGDLLAAWRRVLRDHPNAVLILAGRDDGLGGELRRQAEDLEISGSVVFPGPRRDIFQLMKAADLLVLASHEEGMPNAVLEAMLCKTPVVATRVGGVPELIEHGRTGLLAPPRDPGALAEALLEALSDPEAAEERACAAREHVLRHHAPERVRDNVLEFYAKVTGRPVEACDLTDR